MRTALALLGVGLALTSGAQAFPKMFGDFKNEIADAESKLMNVTEAAVDSVMDKKADIMGKKADIMSEAMEIEEKVKNVTDAKLEALKEATLFGLKKSKKHNVTAHAAVSHTEPAVAAESSFGEESALPEATEGVTVDGEAFGAPAEEEVPVPAEEEVPPPAEEEVPVPAEEEVPPPAEEEIPVPAEEEVPPPAEEETSPPAEEEVPPPAEEETFPPAEEEVSPPAEEQA